MLLESILKVVIYLLNFVNDLLIHYFSNDLPYDKAHALLYKMKLFLNILSFRIKDGNYVQGSI